MPLTILNDTQVNEYISGLDLAEGSEAYRTLNTMLLLPSDIFKKAISALADGLITFQNMRSLPAMNERLVEQLIATKLGSADADSIAWMYKSQWLAANIDISTLRANALGDIVATIAAKFIDRWGGIISPSYDFLKTDETKFHSYIEAYTAYMVSMLDSQVVELLDSFYTYSANLRSTHPALFPTNEKDVLENLMLQLTTQPILLERQSGGRAQNDLLDWVVSASWKQVSPKNYDLFMENAYTAMSINDTPSHSGIDGAKSLYNQNIWGPLDSSSPDIALDKIRLSRIYLPQAYGQQVIDNATLQSEKIVNTAIIDYLTLARTTILAIHEVLSRKLSESAVQYRAVSGSPFGLLLSLTIA